MTRLWPEGDPIWVTPGEDGLPIEFTWQGRSHAVAGIAARWRVRTGWWTEEAWREYIRLITSEGLLCTLYRDLHSGAWYCARLYD